MRTASIFVITAMLSSAALQAQNYQNRYSNEQRPTSSRSTTSRSVQQLNKTSTLVGTEVRTRSDEAVGEVKDVVIDFRSSRVAYIVVDASEMLDGSNSLIAVSPRMLRPGSGQQSLTIDADRNRIEELRTFSSNNYPAISGSAPQMSRRQDQMFQRNQRFRESPDSRNYSRRYSQSQSQPQNRYQDQQDLGSTDDDSELYVYEWYVLTPEFESPGESPYSEQDRFGRGAYGQSQSESSDYYEQYSQDRQPSSQGNRSQNRRSSAQSRGSSQYDRNDDASSSEYDRSQSETYDYDSDRNTGTSGSYQSDQSRSNQQSSRGTQGSQQQTFYGIIQDINYSNQTLTVESDQRTLTFELADQPRLQLNNRENGQFHHFHEGQWVRIQYRYEDGSNKAQSITETGYIDRNSRQ